MFSKIERTAIFSLSAILVFRMLGLFIIIPIFSPYLHTLANASPLLIGLTMGIYGLTQALLQIPFGILSDYIGRREVITVGLVLFFIGSILAGSAGHNGNIYIVLFGRMLQGAGAISGTIMALLSDLTSEQVRTKAMAVIGMSIGAAFMLAFMTGPLLNSILSIQHIFYMVAALVLPILFILWRVVPNANSGKPCTKVKVGLSEEINHISNIIKDKNISKKLVLYCFGIFSLHAVLMINFVAVPMLLKSLGLTSVQQGRVYIEVFLIAILFMVPLIIYSEVKKQTNKVLLLSIGLLLCSELIFWLSYDKFWGIMLGLVIFFIGFNVLEASLPSLVSKLVPAHNRGAAMGVYSTAQFLGPMLGGVLAGILYKYYGLVSIFSLGLAWVVMWIGIWAPFLLRSTNKQQTSNTTNTRAC